MPQLNTYLTFDGNCADAMRFYERTLNGKLEMMTHAESPMAAQASPAMRMDHARAACVRWRRVDGVRFDG